MANLQTVNDLRADALFRAGEPQDSTSSFWTQSLIYLNRVQQDLLLGGDIAVGRDLASSAGIYAHLVGLPITDWWWARKDPRGIITTTAALEGTATVTLGSDTINYDVGPTPSTAGWRIKFAGSPVCPRILSHTGTTSSATMDAVWPDTTLSSAAYDVFDLEYALPSDFLRFCGALVLHGSESSLIPVGAQEELDINFPITDIQQGPPTAAALIQPQTLRLNTYDTKRYRIEFDYIMKPTDLEAGADPLLPQHHRALLAVGAAMLIAFDKSDSKAQELASEFRERLGKMVQEHRRMMSGSSHLYGQFQCRADTSRRQIRQPSGGVFIR